MMTIPEAKEYIGRNCMVSWTDRLGKYHNEVLQVDDLQFMPTYGAYLISGAEEVSLERVSRISAVD